MSKELVARFIDDFIKAINTLYNIYNCLLNFEFGCFNIGLIGFINFFDFYRAESLIITAATILEAKAIKSVLNDKNIVYTARSKRGKKEKRKSINLFIIIVVVGLDDVYFIRSFILFLFIFALQFIVMAFFSVIVIFVFFAAVLFVRTVFEKICIAPEVVIFITMFVVSFESLRL